MEPLPRAGYRRGARCRLQPGASRRYCSDRVQRHCGDFGHAEPEHQWRPAVGVPDGTGADRRDREGRRVPARAHRSGPGRPRPVHPLVRGRRLHGERRPGRQHLRPPAGPRREPPARDDRQPSRFPADRRQVRRRLRRARRAGGDPHAQRPGDRDRRAGRGRRLDQRGGQPLLAADDGLRRLRRRLFRGGDAGAAGQRHRRPARRRAQAHRLRRRGPGRRAGDRRLFRGPYRAGPDPGE